MKLLADENIDRPIVEKLRDSGIDVSYVDEKSKGISDEEVSQVAEDESRIILTFDNDFSKMEDVGFIRLTSPDRYDVVVDAILDIVNSLSEDDLLQTVIEISPSQYRDY